MECATSIHFLRGFSARKPFADLDTILTESSLIRRWTNLVLFPDERPKSSITSQQARNCAPGEFAGLGHIEQAVAVRLRFGERQLLLPFALLLGNFQVQLNGRSMTALGRDFLVIAVSSPAITGFPGKEGAPKECRHHYDNKDGCPQYPRYAQCQHSGSMNNTNASRCQDHQRIISAPDFPTLEVFGAQMPAAKKDGSKAFAVERAHRANAAEGIKRPVCLPEDFLQESCFVFPIVAIALVIDGERCAFVFEQVGRHAADG